MEKLNTSSEVSQRVEIADISYSINRYMFNWELSWVPGLVDLESSMELTIIFPTATFIRRRIRRLLRESLSGKV